MYRSTKLVALAASIALSCSALAQTAPLFQHMLSKMDTNGDGRISQDEFLAAARTRFARIDAQNKGSITAADMANSPLAAERMQHRAQFIVKHLDKAGNGYVTKDEFLAAAEKRFSRLDANGDGKLTPDEFAARMHRRTANTDKLAPAAQKHFDKLDANHDGVITKDEYLAAAAAKFQQFDTQGNGEVTANEIASSPLAQARAQKVAEHIAKHLDTNGDGVITLDEYLAAAKKRFARLDTNGDGYIDAGEVPARGHRPFGG